MFYAIMVGGSTALVLGTYATHNLLWGLAFGLVGTVAIAAQSAGSAVRR